MEMKITNPNDVKRVRKKVWNIGRERLACMHRLAKRKIKNKIMDLVRFRIPNSVFDSGPNSFFQMLAHAFISLNIDHNKEKERNLKIEHISRWHSHTARERHDVKLWTAGLLHAHGSSSSWHHRYRCRFNSDPSTYFHADKKNIIEFTDV